MSRITDSMTTAAILENLNRDYGTLSDTEQELASGRKLNQPSDDPYGAGLAIQLGSQLSGLDAYNRSITDATAWMQASDSALLNVNQMSQRIRELTVQAGDGTQTQSGLDDIATEVDQLTEQIKQEANTQYNGQYIFAGTATTTQPYGTASDAYQGDSGTVVRQIGVGTSIDLNENLAQVLGSGPSAGDGKLLDTLRTISQDLRAGNVSAVTGTDLGNLDTNLDALGQIQADNGAKEDRLQLAASRISSLQNGDASALSGVQDADVAQVAIDFSNQQAAYQAALKAGASIIQPSLMDFLSSA